MFGGRSSELTDNAMSRKELKDLRLGLAASMNEAILKRLCDAENNYFQLKGATTATRDFVQPVAFRLSKVIELSQA